MFRVALVIVILTLLGACGGSRRDKGSESPPPEPEAWYYDPGSSDSGSDDSGSDDSGWDDGSDVSEEKASLPANGIADDSLLLEIVNYDATAYLLFVESGGHQEMKRRLYLPPIPAASPGGSARTTRLFRMRPGSTYVLVLGTREGETLDVQALGTIGSPSRWVFAIVSASLLASQS